MSKRDRPRHNVSWEGKWQKRWSKTEQKNASEVKRRQRPVKGKTYAPLPLEQSPITRSEPVIDSATAEKANEYTTRSAPSPETATIHDAVAKKKASEYKAERKLKKTRQHRKVEKLREDVAKTHLEVDRLEKKLPVKTIKKKAYDEKRRNPVKYKEQQRLMQSELQNNGNRNILHRPTQTVQHGAHGMIHREEKSNVGIEATHKTEKVAEHHAVRKFRQRKYKPHQKLEQAKLRDKKAMGRLQYETTVQQAKLDAKKKAQTLKVAQKRQIRKKMTTAKRQAEKASRTAVRHMRISQGIRSKLGIKLFATFGVAILLFSIIMNAVTAMFGAGGAMAGLLGGIFRTVEGEHYVRDFILDSEQGIPPLRAELAQSMGSVGGFRHVTRVFIGPNLLIDPSISEIESALPTNEELATQIQAVFNGVVMMESEDGLLTNAQAYALLSEMFDTLISYRTITVTEWCGQALTTGQGTVNLHSQCEEVHALGDCPNPASGTHTEFTCTYCCESEDYEYEDDREFIECTGYTVCNGHTILIIELAYRNSDDLFAAYFAQQIWSLEASGANPMRLQSLIAHHELSTFIQEWVLEEYGHYITFWHTGTVGGGGGGVVTGTPIYGVYAGFPVSPFFHKWQWAGYWANVIYGPNSSYSTFSGGGCFPVSFAMIIRSLTGQYVSPVEIGNYIVQRGQRVRGVGTGHQAAGQVMARWGLSATMVGVNSGAITNALQNGQLVFLSVGNSPTNTFTNGGHGIILRGIMPDGRVVVACSARRTVNNHAFDLNFILQHIGHRTGNIWVIGN